MHDQRMSNPRPLPSLSSIDQMDRLRQKAREELEIFDDKARCQRCGVAVKLGEKLTTTSSTTGRITYLKRRIQYMNKRGYDIDNSTKQELAELIKAEEEQDLLKRLRLYSSKLTRYRFCCSDCFDKAYKRRSRKRKFI
jgi:hypothetical protein